jgi:hypothetical protein
MLRASEVTMRRFLATLCICLFATCANAGSHNDPLVFGMTSDEAEQAIGAPLVYLSGPPGSERYLAQPAPPPAPLPP